MSCLPLLLACSNVYMGVDGEPVDVRLKGVSWAETQDHHLRGVVRLQHVDFTLDRWLVNLHIPASAAGSREVMDVSRLPFGSRVFLIDPHGNELRGQIGDVVVSRRGAGRVDAIFGGQGDQSAVGISVDWTRFDVDDRRDISGSGATVANEPE